MEQIIYADILFAVNFSMDFLALYITSFILKRRFSIKRGIVAATIGAIYGIIAVVLDLGTAIGIILTAFVGVLMCVILNGYGNTKLLFRDTVVFLSANLLMGGGMTVVYEYFNAHGGADSILIYGNPETVEQQLPMALFVSAGVIVSIVLWGFGRGISKRTYSKYALLNVEHNGKSATVSALVDSGNLLTEPISGAPVIILSVKTAERILERELIELLSDIRSDKYVIGTVKVRFILYETVSGRGMLGVFKPDRITVNGIDVIGYVAVSDNFSSMDGRDAIVPVGLVN